MKINFVKYVDGFVAIGKDVKSDYVDICENLKDGDILFARHPYTFLTTFQSTSMAGDFWISLEYTKTIDFKKTANSDRCKRVRNSVSYRAPSDSKTGSTIGGTYGFGVAMNSVNDGKEAFTDSSDGGVIDNNPPKKVDIYAPVSFTLTTGDTS